MKKIKKIISILGVIYFTSTILISCGHNNVAIGSTYEFNSNAILQDNCSECDSRWFIEIVDEKTAFIWSAPNSNRNLISCKTQIGYDFDTETGSLIIDNIENKNINSSCKQKILGTYTLNKDGYLSCEYSEENDSIDSESKINQKKTNLINLLSGKVFKIGNGENQEYISFNPYNSCSIAYIGNYWADGPSFKINKVDFEKNEITLVQITDEGCLVEKDLGFIIGYNIDYDFDSETGSLIANGINELTIKPLCCKNINCDERKRRFSFFEEFNLSPCDGLLLEIYDLMNDLNF
tara:strand:+ start:263 stop:1141 length:879 start_codon:yes stop_codon:yes gene_type:complete